MNNNFDDLDNYFKDSFEGFEVTPPKAVWNNISDEMNKESLDQMFEDNLSSLEVQPDVRVWNNVKKELPLNLYIKRQLNWLSRIAAVLLIIMMGIIYFDNKDYSPAEIVQADTEFQNQTNVDTEVAMVEEERDFVFPIEQKDETKEIEDERLEEERASKARAYALWESIVEDDDEFDDISDEIIEAALKPIQQLPIGDIAVMWTAQTKQKVDAEEYNFEDVAETQEVYEDYPVGELKIGIQLRIVDSEIEAEDLIRAYDEDQLAKANAGFRN